LLDTVDVVDEVAVAVLVHAYAEVEVSVELERRLRELPLRDREDKVKELKDGADRDRLRRVHHHGPAQRLEYASFVGRRACLGDTAELHGNVVEDGRPVG